MKALLLLICLASAPAIASDRTALNFLIKAAEESNRGFFWDLETDFSLRSDEMDQLNALPRTDTAGLSASVVRLLAEKGAFSKMESEAVPVVVDCPILGIIVTKRSESHSYIGKGCVRPTDLN
jgi:hypothetical protein